MRQVLVSFVLAVCLVGAGTGAAAPPGLLVTPAWLGEHLADPSLVVLHVSTLREDYTREHIPGARFLWPSWLAISTPELSFEMMPVDTLRAVFERLGVSNHSQVVICHALGDVAAAARVYVTLDYLGMGDRAAILDGGFEAWKAEGRPVSRETPVHARGVLDPQVRKDAIVDLEYVKSKYQDQNVRLVDVRSALAFNLASGVGIFRGGHIPGAVNIPFSAVEDSLHRYQPLDSLRAVFERAGIKPGTEIITYCYMGRSACPGYVAARMLGHDVRLYDGSFEEWSRHEDLPVERAGKK